MLLNEIKSYYNSLRLINNATTAYRRNKLKEFLHIYLLNFLYKHEIFRELIFYGGTCLRHCFDLPRLSEDLDFEYLHGEFAFDDLQTELERYLAKELGYRDLSTKFQKFRIYLKFPVLRELGVVQSDESDFLHLKIEINQTEHDPQSYIVETHPYFGGQHTFFIKRYDLETLMASKINALLYRTWTRHHKERGAVSTAKGRDYFDLLWYMKKQIIPRISFTQFPSSKHMWREIDEKVQAVNPSSIENDLIDFLEDPREAKDFSRNLKDSFRMLISTYYS